MHFNFLKKMIKFNQLINILISTFIISSTLAKLPDTLYQVARSNDNQHLEHTLNNILIPRVVGSSGHKKVSQFIQSELTSLGLNVETDVFSQRVPIFGNLTFTNIIGTFNPNADRFLALACHYDSKYFQKDPNFVGAIDSAVPCAILLNLAKALSPFLQDIKNNEIIGIMFIFFDGEEAFLNWDQKDSVYGAKNLAKKFSELRTFVKGQPTNHLDRIDVMVLLDLIGAKNCQFKNFYYNTEYLHGRLVNIERVLAKDKLLEGKNFQFIAQYANGAVDDDHRPFLEKNVPILHLIATPFPKQWHKSTDTAANLHWPSIRNFNKILRVFVYEYMDLAVINQSVDFRKIQ